MRRSGMVRLDRPGASAYALRNGRVSDGGRDDDACRDGGRNSSGDALALALPRPHAPSPAPAPTETPLPKAAACSPGDTGEDVILLQTMLIGLGFDPGEADGIYGGMLKAAVRDFQLYAGLTADGVAGAQTAEALTARWQAVQQLQPAAQQPLSGFVIGIDPGHQRHANTDQEPIAPGSSVMKPKGVLGHGGAVYGRSRVCGKPAGGA
jgi:peptidoglycan hydrolase-like protein with peptidoglycan-binding domain